MKPETHQGEVAEHVIRSDVQLMLQTQREEEDRVRVLTSVSPRRSKRGVSAWSQNKRPRRSLSGTPTGPLSSTDGPHVSHSSREKLNGTDAFVSFSVNSNLV